MCSQSISGARTRKHGDHPHICVLRWLGVPRIFLSAPLSSDAVAFYLSRGAQHLRDGKLATSYKYLNFAQINDNELRPEQSEQPRGQSFGKWVRWIEHDL